MKDRDRLLRNRGPSFFLLSPLLPPICSWVLFLLSSPLFFCNSRFFSKWLLSPQPVTMSSQAYPTKQTKKFLDFLSSLCPSPSLHIQHLWEPPKYAVSTCSPPCLLLLHFGEKFSPKTGHWCAFWIADEHFLLKTLSSLDYMTKYFLSSSSTSLIIFYTTHWAYDVVIIIASLSYRQGK